MGLANELRPKAFKKIIGQEANVKALSAQAKQHKFYNAYCFVGGRGTGKTTSAKLLAKVMSCKHVNAEGEPCGVCDTCRNIDAGINPDVMELDAARNRSVEDARRLIAQTQFTPQFGEKRVFIIDEAHMLTTEAFNALLKTIEEPPEYCVFILCTTEVHQIPATILSRCHIYRFNAVDEETIAEHLGDVLEEKGLKYEPEAVMLIAKLARGAVRDSISILETCLAGCDGDGLTENYVRLVQGLPEEQELFDFLKALALKNQAGVRKAILQMEDKGFSPSAIISEVFDILSDVITCHAAGIREIYNTNSYKSQLASLCAEMSADQAVALTQVLLDAKKQGVRTTAPFISLLTESLAYIANIKKRDELDAKLAEADKTLADAKALKAQVSSANEDLIKKIRDSVMAEVKAAYSSMPAEAAEQEKPQESDSSGVYEETAVVEDDDEEYIPSLDEIEEICGDTSDSNSANEDDEDEIDIDELFGGGGDLPSKSSGSDEKGNSIGASTEAADGAGKLREEEEGGLFDLSDFAF